ncbi:MAG: DoxX-like family protein [Saccharospirillum sp.]
MNPDFSVTSPALLYAISRLTIAFVWFYHGLVPKWLFLHEDELAMSMAAGFSDSEAMLVAQIGGGLEILIAASLLVFWRKRWPLQLTVVAMLGLLVLVSLFIPELMVAAFNPVTTNLSVAVLSLVCLHFQSQKVQADQ